MNAPDAPSPGTSAPGARLARFAPRRARHGAAYGHFVSVMKVVLPSLALVLTAAVVVWPLIWGQENGARHGVLVASGEDVDRMRMLAPSYAGLDEKAQPFTVTAEEMVQADPDVPRIDLVEPKADILMGDGTWAFVNAETGVYDQMGQLLELRSAVNLFHDQGYELRTEAASFDLVAGDAFGTAPVEGQGPFGTMAADGGFQLLDRGARVMLLGRSRVTIRLDGDS